MFDPTFHRNAALEGHFQGKLVVGDFEIALAVTVVGEIQNVPTVRRRK